MKVNLKAYIANKQQIVQEGMEAYFKQKHTPQPLKQSMLYSLNAGGKRLRPILLLTTYEAYADYKLDCALSSAIALEMIHTYSLIHDDLPAMDDDEYRRGKLTNHKVYDEATAILAGDALLTDSFEIIAEDMHLHAKQKATIIRHLARASGSEGMVGGQILDIEAEKRSVSLEELEKVHTLKTGRLISFAIIIGGFLGGATKEQLSSLNTFADYLGLIFQVQDDILDVVGNEKKLGKEVGSDENNAKSTYPKLLGLEGAIEKKNEYVKKSKIALNEAGAQQSYLSALTDYFSQRDH